MDVAASEFYDKESNKYDLDFKNQGTEKHDKSQTKSGYEKPHPKPSSARKHHSCWTFQNRPSQQVADGCHCCGAIFRIIICCSCMLYAWGQCQDERKSVSTHGSCASFANPTSREEYRLFSAVNGKMACSAKLPSVRYLRMPGKGIVHPFSADAS